MERSESWGAADEGRCVREMGRYIAVQKFWDMQVAAVKRTPHPIPLPSEGRGCPQGG